MIISFGRLNSSNVLAHYVQQETYHNCADIAIARGRGTEVTELPPSKFQIDQFATSQHGAEDIDVFSQS